ncbi:MAG: hypothetical protein WD827_08635 [Solirubrobacterales bacterium]
MIHEHPGLHPWYPLSERPGQVLCGSFLGKGSNAMAVSFAASTCGGSSGWAVFRKYSGHWNIVWKQRDGQRSIAKVGSEIKETVNILGPTDPRCFPTGGTKSRTWHWDGRKFVANSWIYLNPKEFSSPDGNVACVFSDIDTEVVCNAYRRNATPQYSGRLSQKGSVDTCEVAVPSLYEVCFQQTYPGLPPLPLGQTSVVGAIRCTSAPNGITCVMASGPQAGKGFRVNGGEVVEVSR